MRSIRKFLTTMTAAVGLPVAAQAAVIGGSYYAIQYDWAEFYAAADNKPFRIDIVGNPFPNMAPEDVARRLLPVMQASRPPVNVTFTYDTPVEQQHPDYRLVVFFDPANGQNSSTVCATKERRMGPPSPPGRVYVWGIYCRNDQVLSEATGRASATAPEDPDMSALFKSLFDTVFDRSSYSYRQHGHATHH